MIRSILAAVVGCAGLSVAGFAPSAEAQTFDCRRASQPHQRAVCSDPGLRATDRLLSDVFGEALTTANDPDALRYEQQEWSQTLRSCGDAVCLRDAYSDRIAALQPIDQPEPPQRHAARVEPVVEKPAPVVDSPAANSESQPVANEVAPALDVKGYPLETADVTSDSYAEVPLPPAYGDDVAPVRSEPDAATRPKPNPMFSAVVGGVILGLIVCVLLALLATKALADRSMQRYGWPMILNWWNVLHLVSGFALWLGAATQNAIAGLIVAGGLWLIITVVNVRKTDLGTGLAMSVVQPFVVAILYIVISFARHKPKPYNYVNKV